MRGVLVLPVFVAFAMSATSAEPGGPSAQDVQYVERMWQSSLYQAHAKPLELNTEVLRRVADAEQAGPSQVQAWMLLGQIKKPSQLAFLVEVARKHNGTRLWGNLSMEIVNLVKTPEDEKVIRPLLDNDKLFPCLIEALLRTTDAQMLKRIFDEKSAKDYALGLNVMNFAVRRRSLGLPVDPEVAEPFMRAWVLRTRTPGTTYPREALLAADLGYSWSAELLVDIVLDHAIEVPPAGFLSPDGQKNAERSRKAQIESQCRALDALQKLVKEDLGADASRKPDEYLDAAIGKARVWWAKNSKDQKYRLKVEARSAAAGAKAEEKTRK